MLYSIPDKYYYRLHHIRPRFKNDLENVILYMANTISGLNESDTDSFNQELNQLISMYPGNGTKVSKTINNWRTEISSLFGLIQTNSQNKTVKPGAMALMLSERQDVIEFFRYFLFYFQYPGGHLKPHQTKSMIENRIKFKPVPYLIETLQSGSELTEGSFGLSQEETTHCIFNDIRVTSDGRSPMDTAKLIIQNREKNLEYVGSGDIIRYAGDILDYMEVADLLSRALNGRYYLKKVHFELLHSYSNNISFFPDYDPLYSKQSVETDLIASLQDQWFDYVNANLETNIFETDILSLIGIAETDDTSKEHSVFAKQMLEVLNQTKTLSTTDIGNVGENATIIHEKNRLTRLGRKDTNLVNKIPNNLGIGYDIQSWKGIGPQKRYIEVKTTTSYGTLKSQQFSLTSNEWNTAQTLKETYAIYRLMISSEGHRLFVITDPVDKYKTNILDITLNSSGNVLVSYKAEAGEFQDLLI